MPAAPTNMAAAESDMKRREGFGKVNKSPQDF